MKIKRVEMFNDIPNTKTQSGNFGKIGSVRNDDVLQLETLPYKKEDTAQFETLPYKKGDTVQLETLPFRTKKKVDFEISGINEKTGIKISGINENPVKNYQTNEILKEISNALMQTAMEGRGGYSIPKGNWCANFACWVYENTFINGKSIASIVDYSSNSTGELMMHFLTADNPNLGFDYSKANWYKGKNPNISFYYNDHSSLYSGKNSAKLPSGQSYYIPKIGDYVFFDWSGSAWEPKLNIIDEGVQDHTGLVSDIITDEAGKAVGIRTIEGNISGGFYTRNIYFDPTNPNYDPKLINQLIGYGTITNVPSN